MNRVAYQDVEDALYDALYDLGFDDVPEECTYDFDEVVREYFGDNRVPDEEDATYTMRDMLRDYGLF